MVLRSASTLDAFRTLVTALGTAEGVAEDKTINPASCSLLRDWRAFVTRGSRALLPLRIVLADWSAVAAVVAIWSVTARGCSRAVTKGALLDGRGTLGNSARAPL
eukprot:scaffold23402_cov57-Phaeocystis_antarctica.AAC.1